MFTDSHAAVEKAILVATTALILVCCQEVIGDESQTIMAYSLMGFSDFPVREITVSLPLRKTSTWTRTVKVSFEIDTLENSRVEVWLEKAGVPGTPVVVTSSGTGLVAGNAEFDLNACFSGECEIVFTDSSNADQDTNAFRFRFNVLASACCYSTSASNTISCRQRLRLNRNRFRR